VRRTSKKYYINKLNPPSSSHPVAVRIAGHIVEEKRESPLV